MVSQFFLENKSFYKTKLFIFFISIVFKSFINNLNCAEHNHQLTIAIVGNIGVGKTTFINEALSRISGERVRRVLEPIEFWQRYLPIFYNDSKKNSLMFQSIVGATLAGEIELAKIEAQKNGETLIIAESCLDSNETFGKTLFKQGNMTEQQRNIHGQLLKNLNEVYKTDAIIYLRTDKQSLANRIKRRNRPGEDKIESNFLEELQTQFDETVKKRQEEGIPVLFLDNRDLEESELVDGTGFSAMKETVTNFLHRVREEKGLVRIN